MRLDSGEVNYGMRVSVYNRRKKWIFFDDSPPTDGRDITDDRVNARRDKGVGEIVGFSQHGKIRIVRHEDGSAAAYWFDELRRASK